MVCSAAAMIVYTANGNRRIVKPMEAVSCRTDLRLAVLKVPRHNLSMVHQGRTVTAMRRLVKLTTMALRVMHMEEDMCPTNNHPDHTLKEALDHLKWIMDMLLQATVTHPFQDKLKPIKLKEATQQTPTHMGQSHRAMLVPSRMPLN
jgi:hypothetical protein